MCLWDQGIDDDDGGVSRLRLDRGLSDDNRSVVRVQVIYDASEGSEKTTEAARSQGIYENDGGIKRGKMSTNTTTITTGA